MTLASWRKLGHVATNGLKSKRAAYYHVTMRNGYLSKEVGRKPYGIHVKLLEVKVFAITTFSSPAGSLPEHRTFEIFSGGISPAHLLYYTEATLPW